LCYHRAPELEKYEKLFNQSPVVYLTKDRCVYVHDKNDKNSVKEEVTKWQCDVMYLNIKGSESVKVLKKI